MTYNFLENWWRDPFEGKKKVSGGCSEILGNMSFSLCFNQHICEFMSLCCEGVCMICLLADLFSQGLQWPNTEFLEKENILQMLLFENCFSVD